METATITDQEFALFQRLIHRVSGIWLTESKKVLLTGRLHRRLKLYQLETYSQYYRMLSANTHPEELQAMVDLITTNETYFFREPKHFEYLVGEILQRRHPDQTFRVWSAACSTGEEVYTLAMVLADHLPAQSWEVVGSDISTQVLDKARKAHYALERNDGIPPAYLKKYCMKGVRSQEGTFLVIPALRQATHFFQVNLTQPITQEVGLFDVIFLRNVMIYFDMDTKRKVVENLLTRLRPGGYFIVGHSETLHGINTDMTLMQPTIYRKEPLAPPGASH